MTTLAALMLAPERRERIGTQLAKWIDDHVDDAGGVKGFAMKAGLKALEAVRPDALTRGVDRLLPDMVAALEPLYQNFRASKGSDFAAFLAGRNDEATAAILSAVDRRAQSSGHATLMQVYKRLRPTIEGELRKTLPKIVEGIGSLIPDKDK